MKLALNFVECSVPQSWRDDHRRRGGRGLWRYKAAIHDGELRIVVAQEPWDDSGRCKAHVSASIGKPGAIEPFRRPTDDEMAAVRELWSMVKLEEDNNEPDGEMVRHLWEQS